MSRSDLSTQFDRMIALDDDTRIFVPGGGIRRTPEEHAARLTYRDGVDVRAGKGVTQTALRTVVESVTALPTSPDVTLDIPVTQAHVTLDGDALIKARKAQTAARVAAYRKRKREGK